MKESKKMMKKEVEFMKKKGAGMKGMKKYARGGGVERKGKTKGKMIVMRKGGSC